MEVTAELRKRNDKAAIEIREEEDRRLSKVPNTLEEVLNARSRMSFLVEGFCSVFSVA